MSDEVTSQLPLETLALTIKAHVQRGDASIEKAEQHYKAAGIHLMEAKERVMRRRDMTWPNFLLQHCSIRRRRADELISIANGSTSLAELRAATADRVRRHADRNKAARSGGVSNAKSSEKTKQNQQMSAVETEQEDEETLIRDPRAVLISKIRADIQDLDLGALKEVEATIQRLRGEVHEKSCEG